MTAPTPTPGLLFRARRSGPGNAREPRSPCPVPGGRALRPLHRRPDGVPARVPFPSRCPPPLVLSPYPSLEATLLRTPRAWAPILGFPPPAPGPSALRRSAAPGAGRGGRAQGPLPAARAFPGAAVSGGRAPPRLPPSPPGPASEPGPGPEGPFPGRAKVPPSPTSVSPSRQWGRQVSARKLPAGPWLCADWRGQGHGGLPPPQPYLASRLHAALHPRGDTDGALCPSPLGTPPCHPMVLPSGRVEDVGAPMGRWVDCPLPPGLSTGSALRAPPCKPVMGSPSPDHREKVCLSSSVCPPAGSSSEQGHPVPAVHSTFTELLLRAGTLWTTNPSG